MDGFITIGTKLETDKFDKQVAALEKKIKEEEEKKIKIDAEVTNLEEEIRKYDEARAKVIEYKQELKRLNEEKAQMLKADPSMAVAVDTPEYARVKQDIIDINNLIAEEQAKIDKQGPAIDKVAMKLEEAKNKQSQVNEKVDEFKQKIENVNLQKQQAEIEKMKSSFNGVNGAIQSGVRRLGMMALSIIGIRSGLAMLRNASSQLASYDSEYAAKLEYIRFALTQAIAPVLQYIVNLAMKLLSIINAIAQAWFGINIFGKGSVDNFKKMKAGAGGVAKAAKEIHKQLAGFDEMNILQDNGNTSTGGGGGGASMGDLPDLSAWQGEVPVWLQWIMDNRDLILSLLAGIAAGILAIKLGFTGLQALGIGLAVAGIVYAIQSLIEYIKDPSLENFGKVIIGIGVAIVGIGIAIGSLPVIIIGTIVLIVGLIIKYWDQIKAFLQKGIDWLKSKSGWIREHLGGWVGDMYDAIVGFLQNVLGYFDSTIQALKKVFDGIIQFFKGVFTGDWKMAWEGIKNILGGVIDWFKAIFKLWFEWIKTFIITPIVSLFQNMWNGIKTGAQNAWNGVKNIWSTVTSFFKTIFTNAWEAVKRVFSVGGKIFDGIKEGIVNGFKNIVNAIIRGINKVVATPFNAINNILNTLRNVSIAGYQPFGFIHTFNVPQIPQLKTGGIINMPNRGTMLGGMAIGGEAGREGVVPLTDQQAMAELGEAIGKNVLVNLTNITSMNGRVIGRELKKIQSEQEFAYNA